MGTRRVRFSLNNSDFRQGSSLKKEREREREKEREERGREEGRKEPPVGIGLMKGVPPAFFHYVYFSVTLTKV